MFRELQCSVCGCALSGGLDTYGEPGQEMCQEHWLAPTEPETYEQTWYGLAPHHHDLERTGSVIGSTVFDPLPEHPNETGEYEINPGLYFWPDPDALECGIWIDRRLPAKPKQQAAASLQFGLFSENET